MVLRTGLSRPLSVLTGIAITVPLIFGLAAGPARSDTRPPVTVTPTTVSTDPLPTVQIDGVAWTQVIVGDTVYVGGAFTTARPAGSAPGVATVPRLNFLAYTLSTGRLLAFAPTFNGAVRSLAVSPDAKTLYVGGQFTSVNGTTRNRLAAFDLATGGVKTSFAVNSNSSVYGLATTETTVYAAGIFTEINGVTRVNAAALNATTGAVGAFKVTPAGGTVKQVAVSPDRTRVVLGGSFTSLNKSSKPGWGLSLVKATTGATLPTPVNSLIRDAGSLSAITSLTTGPDNSFYGSGYSTGRSGNLEGSFKADWKGNRIWIEDCHGDTYSMAPLTSVVYIAGHPHDCERLGGFPDTDYPVIYHRAVAFTTKATRTLAHEQGDYHDFYGEPAPTLLHWFPDFNVGTVTGQSQGPWHVAATSDYAAYGGEFTTVNGKAQQGLVRFAVAAKAPNTDGPRLNAADIGLKAAPNFFGGSIKVSLPADYDRDNTRLTYAIYRDGVLVSTQTADSAFWLRPTVSYVDAAVTSGHSYAYWVTVTDPFGNARTSTTVSATAR